MYKRQDVADIELGRLAYTFNNTVNGHKAVSCIVYQMAGTNATETISDVYKRQGVEGMFAPSLTAMTPLATNCLASSPFNLSLIHI